jgi:hypothetical protein
MPSVAGSAPRFSTSRGPIVRAYHGSQIAFLSGFGRSGPLPNIGIAVVRPGDAARNVGRPHDRGRFFEGPFLHGWSGDSREIFYSVIDGLEAPLFRVAASRAP